MTVSTLPRSAHRPNRMPDSCSAPLTASWILTFALYSGSAIVVISFCMLGSLCKHRVAQTHKQSGYGKSPRTSQACADGWS